MPHEKIPVAVLGATGTVGQRFVQLLVDHPWFEITALAASERSAGKSYRDACNWVIPGDPPAHVGDMIVQPLTPNLPAKLIFSAIPSGVAREIEPEFAKAGYAICSNASAFRNVDGIPLIIPEVNADHLGLIAGQREKNGWTGFIVTSPNCTTTGPTMALKPLHDAFGVRKVFMASMQAISGAGYPGVPAMDIMNNVVPYIPGEESKFQQELSKMLGTFDAEGHTDAPITLSAHANRVPVLDGHTVAMSIGFDNPPSVEQALDVIRNFKGHPHARNLPSAPPSPLVLRMEDNRPQPRRDVSAGGGMSTSVGRVRTCPLLDLRMITVVHNTLRGAASGAVLNAELLVSQGYVSA